MFQVLRAVFLGRLNFWRGLHILGPFRFWGLWIICFLRSSSFHDCIILDHRHIWGCLQFWCRLGVVLNFEVIIIFGFILILGVIFIFEVVL